MGNIAFRVKMAQNKLVVNLNKMTSLSCDIIAKVFVAQSEYFYTVTLLSLDI